VPPRLSVMFVCASIKRFDVARLRSDERVTEDARE
jgi:hypothetical protein